MLNQTIAAMIGADYAGLVAMLTRKLHDAALAEDLVHQAFVESLDKLARQQIADPSRFSGFVYAVAFNLLRNHRRRMDNRSDARASEATLETLPADGSPFGELCRENLVQQIRQAVDDLPVARDREVVRCFYLREECKMDICRKLGIAPLRFDKILFRARRRMMTLMQQRGIGPHDACRDAQ